ncbi:MAG: acyl-CoA dehydrogenase family protein [Hyphomonadaceae bacterium]
MNIDESSADKAFRAEAHDWLQANAPKRKRPVDHDAALDFDREWQRTQYDGGWAGVNWPKEYGGRGLSGFHYMIWLQECIRLGAPSHSGAFYTGLYHAGPTLIVRGNENQKGDHLPRILKGEEMWCQGFSEPGAGTDLAAMRTRGEIDGDHIVINGHKTWTSNAHFADYQELVVRTDPDSQRHRGLTWIICDMHAPGVTIRPIKTMMGESEVNDTFYDNVRLPIANVVGEIGDGWSVAMSTLSFERGTAFIGDQIALAQNVEELIEIAKRTHLPDGRLAIKDDAIAQRLALVKAHTVAIKSLTLSILGDVERRGQPGPEGSMMKLLVTTVHKQLFELASDILGVKFLEYGEDRTTNFWTYKFMWSWVLTIAGGSNEIQRDIIADRVLNLPRAR